MSGRHPDTWPEAERLAEEHDVRCDYAPEGKRTCEPWICDCFILEHPDSPFALHPEDFVVLRPEKDASN